MICPVLGHSVTEEGWGVRAFLSSFLSKREHIVCHRRPRSDIAAMLRPPVELFWGSEWLADVVHLLFVCHVFRRLPKFSDSVLEAARVGIHILVCAAAGAAVEALDCAVFDFLSLPAAVFNRTLAFLTNLNEEQMLVVTEVKKSRICFWLLSGCSSEFCDGSGWRCFSLLLSSSDCIQTATSPQLANGNLPLMGGGCPPLQNGNEYR